MSWSPLPVAPTRAKVTAALTASTTPGSGTQPARLSLAFRHAQFEGVTWLTAGAQVSVLVGHGEHAGMLRIEPNGLPPVMPVTLSKPPGSMVALRLPPPPGLPPAKRASVALEFDYADRWIEVTLPPAWRLETPRGFPAPSDVPAPLLAPRATDTTPERGRALAAQAAAMARAKVAR